MKTGCWFANILKKRILKGYFSFMLMVTDFSVYEKLLKMRKEQKPLAIQNRRLLSAVDIINKKRPQ